MLKDLMEEAKKVGLELHQKKTKFLANCAANPSHQKSLNVEGTSFELLPESASTKYLGRALCLFRKPHRDRAQKQSGESVATIWRFQGGADR